MASWHKMTPWHVPEHHESDYGTRIFNLRGPCKDQNPGAVGGAGAAELSRFAALSAICQLKSKSNRIDSLHSGKGLSSLQVTALQAKACQLHRLALIKSHACAGQPALLYSCGLAFACCMLRFSSHWTLRLKAAELSHIPCSIDSIATYVPGML